MTMRSSYWERLVRWNPPNFAEESYVNHVINSSLIERSAEIQAHAELLLVPEADTKGSGAYKFKKFLFSYLCYSRKDKKIVVGAANAITILNRAKMPFSAMNLQGIQIPGANLQNSIFHRSHIERADLTGCNLESSFMSQASISGTIFEGVEFGARPYISINSPVSVISVISHNLVIIGTKKGTIEISDLYKDDHKLLYESHAPISYLCVAVSVELDTFLLIASLGDQILIGKIKENRDDRNFELRILQLRDREFGVTHVGIIDNRVAFWMNDKNIMSYWRIEGGKIDTMVRSLVRVLPPTMRLSQIIHKYTCSLSDRNLLVLVMQTKSYENVTESVVILWTISPGNLLTVLSPKILNSNASLTKAFLSPQGRIINISLG